MSARQEFKTMDLFINEFSGKTPYRKTNKETRSNFSWGQRKLLLGKILALTMFWDPVEIPQLTCVYAGASPFSYYRALYELFGDKITWELYDPREIKIDDDLRSHFHVHTEYFTDATAELYKDRKDVFFFSDIRTVDTNGIQTEVFQQYGIKTEPIPAGVDHTKWVPRARPVPFNSQEKLNLVSKLTTERIENGIFGDMELQERWVLLMNPVHAFLKMRLPYVETFLPERLLSVQYLAGELLLQPWAKKKSTETRLHPRRNEEGKYYRETWDSKEYEQLLASHNLDIRGAAKRYINPVSDDPSQVFIDEPELLDDWDCTAEAYILKLYLEKIGLEKEAVPALSKWITTQLSTTKSLVILRNLQLNDQMNIVRMLQ